MNVERSGSSGIRARIAETLPELIAQWKPGAIGVGYGGPVDWKTGRIKCESVISSLVTESHSHAFLQSL